MYKCINCRWYQSKNDDKESREKYVKALSAYLKGYKQPFFPTPRSKESRDVEKYEPKFYCFYEPKVIEIEKEKLACSKYQRSLV